MRVAVIKTPESESNCKRINNSYYVTIFLWCKLD